MQGAEGADLERRQILEEQCRAATETLFKKRRELQQLQSNFDAASRELMEIRGEKNDIDRKIQDVDRTKEATKNENEMMKNRLDRSERNKDSKLNNVRAVVGPQFDESGTHIEILADVENKKHDHLLNALAQLVHDPVFA